MDKNDADARPGGETPARNSEHAQYTANSDQPGNGPEAQTRPNDAAGPEDRPNGKAKPRAILSALLEALRTAGQPIDHVEADGKLHRYSPDGHRTKLPCWYVAHWLRSGHLTAAFGDWRGSAPSGHRWRSWEALGDVHGIDPEERDRVEREQEEQRRKHEQAKAKKQQAAAEAAQRLWDCLSETGTSAYLERKQVGAFGIRFGRDRDGSFIAVPLRGPAGDLRGLQRIWDSGKKSFGYGTAKKGAYHLLVQLGLNSSTVRPPAVCPDRST